MSFGTIKKHNGDESSHHIATIIGDDEPDDDGGSHELSAAAGLLNDRYHLIRELGHGGMAVVYLAEDVETNREVAVKMMSARLTGTGRQRFTREFSTIASIKHPHCIDVFEYGESEQGPFFAMELFRGGPATTLIGQPMDVVLKAIYEIALAIDFVHSRRIIHRDIKPGNILARRNPDGDGFEVKLADFGLAKFANTSSSMSGDIDFLGTVAYCAPEQILREKLDHRADLYSFGIVCFELLSGQHPFQNSRKNVQALVADHLKQIPPMIRQTAPELSSEIDAAVMQMLAKDAGDRPLSTQPLRSAIAHQLGWIPEESESSAESQVPQRLVAAFVARGTETAAIETVLSESLNPAPKQISGWAETPVPSVVFVTGDAGIGKSGVLRQAARAALVERARIYEGRCFDGNLSPFQPFVEIVKQLLLEQEQFVRKSNSSVDDHLLASTTLVQAGDSTGRIDRVVHDYAPELLRIGPELRHFLAGEAFRQPDVAEESDYIFRAVASFFIELAKVQPTCLLLEDLHWADQSTLHLLRHLASALETARREAVAHGQSPPRLFLCGTSRVGSQYAATDEFMASLSAGRQIALQEFDPEATRELIATLVTALPTEIGESLVQQTLRICAGNPFYITQSVKEWQLHNQLERRDGVWQLRETADDDSALLPASVGESLRARIRSLPGPTKKVLAVAAVIGSVVDVDLLKESLASSDGFEFLDALDELLARNILQETGQVKRVEFTHDLLREVTVEQLSPSRRQGLHERVGEALERALADGKSVTLATLAEHFHAAGIHRKAYDYLWRAGQQALDSYAYDDAVLLLDKAEQVETAEPHAGNVYELQFALAEAHAGTSQVEESIPHYKQSVECSPDTFRSSQACFGLGKVYQKLGRSFDAKQQLDLALAHLGETQPHGLLGAMFRMCASALQFHVIPAWVSLTPGSPQRRREQDLASRIYFVYCMIVVDFDLIAYVYASLRNAVVAKRSGNRAARALGYSKYGFNLSLSGLTWMGRHYAKLGQNDANDCGSTFVQALTAQNVGSCCFYEGRLDEAERLLRECLPILERTQDWHYGFSFHMLRHIASQRGDARQIVEWARFEQQTGARMGDTYLSAWANYGLADGLSRSGCFEEALGLGRTAIEHLENATDNGALTRTVAYQEMGRVQLQCDDHFAARRTLERAAQTMRQDWFYFEFAMATFPLLAEAILGQHWAKGPASVDKITRTQVHRAARRARVVAWVFVNIRAHAYRISGRAAVACGKTARGIKFFNKAIRTAEQSGARGELARALLDKSAINPQTAAADRKQATRILEELGAVIHPSEQQALGLT